MKKYIQEKFIRIVHIYFAETLGTTNKKPSSLFPYAKRQTHVTSQIHLVQHATHQNIFFFWNSMFVAAAVSFIYLIFKYQINFSENLLWIHV